jgi:hypothetical protein
MEGETERTREEGRKRLMKKETKGENERETKKCGRDGGRFRRKRNRTKEGER